MKNDSLGDRMKGYERVSSTTLPCRLPVIVRVDGRAFHSATRGLDKPFDLDLVEAMNRTTVQVCAQVSGTQLAYIQSDEVSFLIHGYKTIETQPYFSNVTQKVVSVIASEFTAHFAEVKPFKMRGRRITFDCRAFVLPENDVNNYFLWRQRDAQRNSVQMFARTIFSAKQLLGMSNEKVKQLILEKTGKSFSDSVPPWFTEGRLALNVNSLWETHSAPSFKEKPDVVNCTLGTSEATTEGLERVPLR
jgi:tRNA(His) 5'-end guanylyltransferase